MFGLKLLSHLKPDQLGRLSAGANFLRGLTALILAIRHRPYYVHMLVCPRFRRSKGDDAYLGAVKGAELSFRSRWPCDTRDDRR